MSRRSSCSTGFRFGGRSVVSLRGGTSFWVTAGGAGVRSSILTVPITFPPEDVPNGELLSGLPLPDLRGTMGTFYYFATDLSRYEEGNTEFGGILRRLVFEGKTARAQLVGPPESDRPHQDPGDPAQGPADRRRPHRGRRARGEGGRHAADVRDVDARQQVGRRSRSAARP